MRVAGHALTLVWSGEHGPESSSTGYCKCGWSESASSQKEVRREYRFHLESVKEARAVADIEVWAAAEDGEMGPVPVGYFTTQELAKRAVVREFRASDEAKQQDYAESWEERQVKAQLGVPSQLIPVYNVKKVGFRPKWRNHPDGDLQLAVWKRTGPYGPGWDITNWLVEKIKVLDTLDGEEVP